MGYREYEVRLELTATVRLPYPEDDSHLLHHCCDPDAEMTDRDAIESAISSAISQRCKVFVYGEDRRPADVWIDLDLSNDLHVEGFARGGVCK